MKEPEKTPLNPLSPRTKKVKQIPMPELEQDTESVDYDMYTIYDPESVFDRVNQLLDEISNEDSQNSH